MSAISGMTGGASLYYRYEKSQSKHDQNIMNQTAAQSVVNNIRQNTVTAGSYAQDDPDALVSIRNDKTGESVSIYRSEDSLYLAKGTYANGTGYVKQIFADQVDPHHCTYLEFLVLSVHTSQNTNSYFSELTQIKDRAGTGNFFEKADYMGAAADLMNEQKQIGNWNGYLNDSQWLHGIAQYSGCVDPGGRSGIFDQKVDGRTAPYSSLADENGFITYNGVEMHCDFENNALCIGNMSNEKNVLTIPLSKGGALKINRDNFDCLPHIISMFSPEDRFLIMRAITLDNQIQRIKNDIDNEDFTDTETENYSITKDEESGDITIYDKQADRKIVLSSKDELNIQKDAISGLSMIVPTDTGKSGAYQSIQMTQELEDALKAAFHREDLTVAKLQGYSVQTDALTGIQYLTKDGEEDRGIPFLDESGRVNLLILADRAEESEETDISRTQETAGEDASGDEENEFSSQQIIIRPDGTRILMLTTTVNGIQSVLTLKLSEKEISQNPSEPEESDTADTDMINFVSEESNTPAAS